MNVFAIRDRLISDYAAYIESFINIQDQHIRAVIDRELREGLLWPDPLLQLNPSFEPGPTIDALVDAGTLHPDCRRIFRIKEQDKPDKLLHLHKHQADAIQAAQSVDHVLRRACPEQGRRDSGKGIQAVVVYPMNALANSQIKELEKFLCLGLPEGKPPVTFKRYTGQEKDDEREAIITDPPDILLTNYVMLELLLTRPRERNIVNRMRGLQFLVLDELHTYRGRQGADVALLVRRVREVCQSPNLQCVGTSATLAEGGTFAEQQHKIAQVASRLFGAVVKPERIIGETLRRATPERDLNDPAFVAELTRRLGNPQLRPPKDYHGFVAAPLSIWIESTFGLEAEPGTGRLRRARPISITGAEGAAHKLSTVTGVPPEQCVQAIQATLLAGYAVPNPQTGFPTFAFRLHQFISRGDTVYASLERPEQRYITTRGQQFVPGDRSRVLLPLAFCRECGQEYYVVRKHMPSPSSSPEGEGGKAIYLPRDLIDQSLEDDDKAGFLYANPDHPWPAEAEAVIERLPEDWVELRNGVRRVKNNWKARLPALVRLDMAGQEDEHGAEYHFVQSPFRFCLNCGVAYGGRERSDFGKLASLGTGGRSTATTVLSLSALQALRRDETLEHKARKLLSFTDNRQDASLQAGHFNDLVEVGLLRAALYRAVLDAGPDGLTHEQLPQRVFDALNLPLELYAVDSTVKFQARKDTERALREVLAYRIYQDLKRGWRVTSPNLEQCGLLEIHYTSLDELCQANEEWANLHPALATALPADRARIAKALLDYLRRELAIRVDYLEAGYQERIQQISSQRLIEPWAIDENEKMERAAIAFPRSIIQDDYGGNVYLSARSGMGLFLRRSGTFPAYPGKITMEDTERILRDLLEALRVAGLVEIVQESDDAMGYQVPASALVWVVGDGTQAFHDPIRVPQQSSVGGRTNPFFLDFYQNVAADLKGIEAKEHTAQVPDDQRQEREARFREAALPVLYCSPTMELGVDIAQLNAVNMRNVPPTPANYAQRSGRAGRSGQPALIFTYCTTGSPHDQYFFKRPEKMVYGSVAVPRLDLANEDLVRAHVHATWLAETGLSLGASLKDLLDLAGDAPTLELQPHVRQALESQSARQQAAKRLTHIFETLEDELRRADWYADDWLTKTLDLVGQRFDQACKRWRDLYRAALRQREVQHKVIQDASRSAEDKAQAKRLRAEAESQMELLTGSDERALYQSDFYSYRYFASEGFLPGYSFPRLPLSAYIPGRRIRKQDSRDEFLSRPRFLAISEFGPRSILYHEGSRYVINKVILPVGEDVLTTRAKLCPHCGYLHPIAGDQPGPDLCEACRQPLDYAMRSLFCMQNVATKRRDRINCDEEERMRMGYDIKTGVRFAERGGQRGYRVAQAVTRRQGEEVTLLRLTYGDAATLWRINTGWKRRRDDQPAGFVLDVERGYWARSQQETQDDQDPMSPSLKQVVPFVEDHRNCLLIEPAQPLSAPAMASLQPALKTAIQVIYQLEDNELSAEPLPNAGNRRIILLYESAEGGAGVLRQLLDDAAALPAVAREALRLCHFSNDGQDLRRAPGSKEDCEAACYDCLMSYTNQTDHKLLDRKLVRDFLMQLAASTVKASPVAADRAEHLRRLKALCESDLEREWLDWLETHNLRLPDAAQKLITLSKAEGEACNTRPDFLYSDLGVAVYIDGPDHDLPDIKTKDEQMTQCLEDAGYTVARFGYNKGEWAVLCGKYDYVFGGSKLGAKL